MRARVHADGLLRMSGHTWRAALGRGGISSTKHEGDGATPAGLLPLRRVLYRADRVSRPRAAVPLEPLSPTDGWCDDPASGDYNRPVRLPHSAHHEELWRSDALYDLIGVLGWNDEPVAKSRGSAIFLHVARPDFGPTEGCVALLRPELETLLALGVTEIEIS